MARAILVGLMAAAIFPLVGNAAVVTDPRLDAVASYVAGEPVHVQGETDQLTWVAEAPNITAQGFVDHAFDPMIYLSPRTWKGLEGIEDGGVSSLPPFYAGEFILELVHEATHLKLRSYDEGRVNACALTEVPSVLARFYAPATATRKVTTHTHYTRRVKVHGHWVKRTFTRTTTHTVTGPNPLYVSVLQGATDFYKSQPFPYNAGTCT